MKTLVQSLLLVVAAAASEVVFMNIRTNTQPITVYYSDSPNCDDPGDNACDGPFTLDFGETHRVQKFNAERIYLVLQADVIFRGSTPVDPVSSQNFIWILGAAGGSPDTSISSFARPGTDSYLPMDKTKYRLHFVNGFGSTSPISIHINSLNLMGTEQGLGYGQSLLFDIPAAEVFANPTMNVTMYHLNTGAPTLLDRVEVDVSSLCQESASNIVLQGRLGTGNADFDPQIVVVEGDDDCTDGAFAVHALSSLLLIVPLFVLSILREF